jgi:hypothetical protein
MAQRVEVLLTDDLDGSTIAAGKGETVQFSLDGTMYEIDLTTKNAAGLRKVLQPYIGAGRRHRNDRAASAKRTKVGPDPKTVKQWARANGYEVKDRGRVSNEIMAAFEAAN